MNPSYGVAGFDSAACMLAATGCILEGKEFPALGHARYLQHLVRLSEILPKPLRRAVYAAATGVEGVSQSKIDRVSFDNIADWTTGLYKEPLYPTVFIGSSSGALVHLAAALKAPWLPQTFLIAVRRKGGGVDDPKGDVEQARDAGLRFLKANPNVQLHQMHDPNQDRLSLQWITYFRPKYLRLPPAYRRFLRERVQPGGTVVVSECAHSWPTTRIADRYLFQFGAVGGLEAQDYFDGGPKVAEYLERYKVGIDRWDPPRPDGESPEAEWGFEPSLMRDIEEVARERDLRLVRMRFDDAQDLSPPVADFHRHLYRRRGIEPRRLLVESFVLIEPYWTLRSGSVPYWMTFNMGPSLEALNAYLDGVEPFDDIRMMLFPHGTESAGLPPIEAWREVLKRGTEGGDFLGVSERAYPHHFSALARYYIEASKLPAEHPLPEPAPFADFERFIAEAGDKAYAVELTQ